jgi:hypothetical protein
MAEREWRAIFGLERGREDRMTEDSIEIARQEGKEFCSIRAWSRPSEKG